MIRTEDVFYIGYISRVRGIHGEVELTFTDDVFDRGTVEYLVFDMDGILVPYFWNEYRFKNAETAIFSLEDIADKPAARNLIGRKVFYPLNALSADEANKTPMSWKSFVGYRVVDDAGNELGTVQAVDDSSQNILLYLTTPKGKEVIIPLHEDFVTACLPAERCLHLCLPDGLLQLNA